MKRLQQEQCHRDCNGNDTKKRNIKEIILVNEGKRRRVQTGHYHQSGHYHQFEFRNLLKCERGDRCRIGR